jgi:excinuclease ABC subunit A
VPHHDSPLRCIQLRGVQVNNLQNIDLDIPHRELITFCGVSGSGKTSLALDTLYAEGQRRYIESFSAYTRQFLARLPKPDAERIDGIPPAIAVTHRQSSHSSRATVGTATEILDYLRLLFSRVGSAYCPKCGRRMKRYSADSISALLDQLPDRSRYMVAFQGSYGESDGDRWVETLRQDGFIRWISGTRTCTVDDASSSNGTTRSRNDTIDVVVDRLTAGQTDAKRVRESLETALDKGSGRCIVFVPADVGDSIAGALESNPDGLHPCTIDDRQWLRIGFSQRLECQECGVDFPKMDPRLFSFNSPMGACPECEGFGNIMDIDMDLVVPDRSKSLSQGAVAPWNTPAYRHELEELLELADDYRLPTDIPFQSLAPEHLAIVQHGVPVRNFGGLDGFFHWLERRKYKMHVRVFLSRWRSYRVCERCHGRRLRDEALATRIQGKNLAEMCGLQIHELILLIDDWEFDGSQASTSKMLLDQIRARLGFLETVGLQYLSLDRSLRSLSGGESQRVALTSALGSSLVNMLYVLDEPSVGLHPQDVGRLVHAIKGLCKRGNTVVMVEHDEALIGASDRVIEIGPGAGEDGGRITFEGSARELRETEGVLTGDYLSGRRGRLIPETRRASTHGWIKLTGARGNNLKNLTVEFPLGVLCVVTGVSGSGKSTLVEQTLYPALCRRKGKEGAKPLDFDEVVGDGQLDDVLLVDQSPIGRSPRSNPVTYIKAFDAIRKVFAETLEARTRNFKASHFSFNVDGGRCPACNGDGAVAIDMQFLADVHMQCGECQGRRYRREILEILYRNKSIADVLEMTVRHAYSFFRGQPKVQARLQQLIDVGLDYLRLGQAANTLSAGEAQRLKLAGYLSAPRRGRTLFLLDEPTTGLHYSDVVQLLDCFEALLEMGHSLIVVEHNLQMIQAADYVIDLGPEAADRGGELVVWGTPEHVARCDQSATGRVLAPLLLDQSQTASS